MRSLTRTLRHGVPGLTPRRTSPMESPEAPSPSPTPGADLPGPSPCTSLASIVAHPTQSTPLPSTPNIELQLSSPPPSLPDIDGPRQSPQPPSASSGDGPKEYVIGGRNPTLVSESRGVVFATLRTALDALKGPSVMFPPLQTTVEGILSIVNAVDVSALPRQILMPVGLIIGVTTEIFTNQRRLPRFNVQTQCHHDDD